VVKQMSELLTLEGDQMDVLNAVVDVMGKQWTNIMADKDKLCKAIGKKEFGELKCLRVDYFDLLLQTKKVLVGSIEQSKIQRENLANLLEILGNVTDTGFSSEGILDFDEGMATLQKWMDPTKLQRVMEKWSDLNKRLEAKKSKMQQLVEKFKKQSKFWRWFTGIAVSLAVVTVVATVVALIVCTSGAGAVIAGGAAKTTVICGKAFLTAHLINAGFALSGAGVALVAGWGGVAYLWWKEPSKMAKQAEKISNLLQNMLARVHELKGKISDMQDEEEKIEERYTYLKDKKRVEAMKEDLRAIDQYLINYQQKGDAAVLAVRDAYNAFIEN